MRMYILLVYSLISYIDYLQYTNLNNHTVGCLPVNHAGMSFLFAVFSSLRSKPAQYPLFSARIKTTCTFYIYINSYISLSLSSHTHPRVKPKKPTGLSEAPSCEVFTRSTNT